MLVIVKSCTLFYYIKLPYTNDIWYMIYDIWYMIWLIWYDWYGMIDIWYDWYDVMWYDWYDMVLHYIRLNYIELSCYVKLC